jgi:hypothetical protein
MTDSQAKQVPLIDLLDAVPVDVRIGVDDGHDWKAGTTWHPVGRLCHDASAELRRLHQSEREGWRHAAELEQERERLTNLCHDYLGELTAMRAVKQMQAQKVRFKCTVIDDQHPNGVPLEQWGNSAHRQWVGLSEEEIDKLKHLIDWTATWSHGRFAYEIEQLLKEKNA